MPSRKARSRANSINSRAELVQVAPVRPQRRLVGDAQGIADTEQVAVRVEHLDQQVAGFGGRQAVDRLRVLAAAHRKCLWQSADRAVRAQRERVLDLVARVSPLVFAL